MPMGSVSSREFEKIREELEKSESKNKTCIIVPTVDKGRNGVREVPESLRKVVGENAKLETISETARAFGLSPSSVSAYMNGATSTASYNDPDPALKDHMKSVDGIITSKARKKLMKAINNMTQDKFESAGLKELSSVGRDLSQIIANVEKKSLGDGLTGAQFIFFTPPQKVEEKYDIIEVRDNG
jgi:predicted transcriptional regulator